MRARSVREAMAPRWRSFLVLTGDAAQSLLQRPWHAVGMVSGILLGVASATAAVAIADTQQAQIDLRFDLQRSSHAVVRAQTPDAEGFEKDQVDLVRRLAPVSTAGEFSQWSDAEPVSRSVRSSVLTVPVVVADPGGITATDTRVVAGASTDLLRSPEASAVAWVGQDLAARLGVGPWSGSPATDSEIVVAGHAFSVAGVLGNDAGFGYVEDAVVLSRPTVVASLGGVGRNVRLVAQVRPGSAAAVAAYVVDVTDPRDQLGLVDVTPPDGRQLAGDVSGDLRRVGAALGGVVGLVGMVAIANTLMMSVHHRLRELGLRSAMGWSRRRIGLLVLTESGVAGLGAGILGSALGLAVAAAWCWSQGWTLVVPRGLPLVVVAGGIAASLVGGLVPALRAASVSPLTAMRS